MPTRHTPAHAPLPDDLLTLRAAAAMAGRSADTLRRWRATHGLRDYRDPADPTAPSTFSRSELLDLLARVNARKAPPGADYIDGVVVPADPVPTRPAVSSTVETPTAALLRLLVDDLRADRDRLLAEAQTDRARADAAAAALDAARRDTLALAVRLEHLETLLLSGKARALDAERAKLGDRLGVKVKPNKAKRKG
jgi:hypothetical protein